MVRHNPSWRTGQRYNFCGPLTAGPSLPPEWREQSSLGGRPSARLLTSSFELRTSYATLLPLYA